VPVHEWSGKSAEAPHVQLLGEIHVTRKHEKVVTELRRLVGGRRNMGVPYYVLIAMISAEMKIEKTKRVLYV
jgi:hypothetical protein